jgi:hypothetical protein
MFVLIYNMCDLFKQLSNKYCIEVFKNETIHLKINKCSKKNRSRKLLSSLIIDDNTFQNASANDVFNLINNLDSKHTISRTHDTITLCFSNDKRFLNFDFKLDKKVETKKTHTNEFRRDKSKQQGNCCLDLSCVILFGLVIGTITIFVSYGGEFQNEYHQPYHNFRKCQTDNLEFKNNLSDCIIGSSKYENLIKKILDQQALINIIMNQTPKNSSVIELINCILNNPNYTKNQNVVYGNYDMKQIYENNNILIVKLYKDFY